MACFFVAFQTRTHAFIAENRLRNAGISCEITHLPGRIAADLCNVGVRVPQNCFQPALDVLKNSGINGYRLFREVQTQNGTGYAPIVN